MQIRTKLFRLAAIALITALQPVVFATSQQEKQGDKMTTGKEAAPMVCVLNGLTAEQRKRQSALKKQMEESAREVSELADGYAFRFPGDQAHIMMLAEFMSLERLCCPFFNFELEVAAGKDAIWLRMTGREGVKEFLKAEFDLK
jgi:hypothetical protein